ncbi:MAG: hypothetical protein NDI93_01440 [Pseudomonas sp.]|nr:hypothetical protein [Pseudomonas sp.]
MHNLINHRWPLLAMVATLAGVTAASVAMAINALIDDALLAGLFATAAVVLDLFKYIAWPLALGLLAMRRALCALLMMGCALALGGVSGWATYDRLMTSIVTSRAEVQAHQVQRLADLEEQRRADAWRIEQLDAEALATREQAAALRAKDFARRAQEMEDSAMARIDAQRDAAISRRDAASQELTAIRSQPAKGAGLPLELATLLCLGFAAALEIVPALILSALRPAPDAALEQAQERAPETVPAAQERIEEQAETVAPEQPGTVQDKARSELEGDDADLLQTLLSRIASAGSGTKVAVRKFAREVRIGNERAARILQQAAALGAINKTATGYVAA